MCWLSETMCRADARPWAIMYLCVDVISMSVHKKEIVFRGRKWKTFVNLSMKRRFFLLKQWFIKEFPQKLESNVKWNMGWNSKPSVKAFAVCLKTQHFKQPLFTAKAMNIPILRGGSFIFNSEIWLSLGGGGGRRMFVSLTAARAEEEEIEWGADRQGLILHFHHRAIPS